MAAAAVSSLETDLDFPIIREFYKPYILHTDSPTLLKSSPDGPLDVTVPSHTSILFPPRIEDREYYIYFPYIPYIPFDIVSTKNTDIIRYYSSIHPLLLDEFIKISKVFESNNFIMLCVGGFAKHLYTNRTRKTAIPFGDFDFQVFLKDDSNNYLSHDYSSKITDSYIIEIGKYIQSILSILCSKINSHFTLKYPNIKLISGLPPGANPLETPIKIIIQYTNPTNGHDTFIKIADFNYSRRNVFAYNPLGRRILSLRDGKMPIMSVNINYSNDMADVNGVLRTLLPCAFFIEKDSLLNDLKNGVISPDSLPPGFEIKIRRDFVFWRKLCTHFDKKGIDSKHGISDISFTLDPRKVYFHSAHSGKKRNIRKSIRHQNKYLPIKKTRKSKSKSN
jgi:hypothetical protein